MKGEYVLRERDAAEIHRLEFQHQVWKDTSDKAIALAKLEEDDFILDLGSGPGYLSFDLRKQLAPEGKLLCIDNSDQFLDFIKRQKYRNVSTLNLDIRQGFSNHFKTVKADKIFCRWVLMFNGELDQIVKEAYNSLKKRGKFISIEYFDFQKIEIFPASKAFRKTYEKVDQLLKMNGGNSNVGSQIAGVMKNQGFSNIQQHRIYKKGEAGSPLWQWLEKTNENHINLVKAGLMELSELKEYYGDWEERAKMKQAYLVAPPLMITIAEK